MQNKSQRSLSVYKSPGPHTQFHLCSVMQEVPIHGSFFFTDELFSLPAEHLHVTFLACAAMCIHSNVSKLITSFFSPTKHRFSWFFFYSCSPSLFVLTENITKWRFVMFASIAESCRVYLYVYLFYYIHSDISNLVLLLHSFSIHRWLTTGNIIYSFICACYQILVSCVAEILILNSASFGR